MLNHVVRVVQRSTLVVNLPCRYVVDVVDLDIVMQFVLEFIGMVGIEKNVWGDRCWVVVTTTTTIIIIIVIVVVILRWQEVLLQQQQQLLLILLHREIGLVNYKSCEKWVLL